MKKGFYCLLRSSVIPAKAGIQLPDGGWIPDQVGNDKKVLEI